MRQAGRYLPEYRELRRQAGSFLDLCYTPELAAEITLQPIRRFDMDAAILFSDILVIPHALGQELRFVEGEGPKLGTLGALSQADVAAHIAPVLETVRRVRAELTPEKALIGFAGAPWTVACYMVEGGGSRDFEKARAMAYGDPNAFAALISMVTEATVFYLRAQVEAGANVLQLFDSWAGAASEALFAEYIIAPTQAIVSALKQSHPHIPIIGFPRMANYEAFAAQAGVDAVSVDYAYPLAKAAALPVAVQGNLDPVLLASDGEGALAQAKRIREAFAGKPFVFNLGHGMLPHTPLAHVERLSDYLRHA